MWHWPLKIGVPAGPQGEPLLAYLRDIRNGWIEELGLLQPVGEARDACDLLILPSGMAAELAEQARLRLQASFIVCLDEPVPWSAAPDTPQARLRAKLGAAGVALVGASFDLRSWYEWLIRELSHDLPMHAALWGAGRARLGRLPVMLGEPESLDRLRILAVAEHLDRKHELLRQPLSAEPLPQVEPDAKYSYTYIPPRTRSLGKAAPAGDGDESDRVPEPRERVEPEPTRHKRQLSTMVRTRPFESEQTDGKPVADAIAAKKVALEAKRRLRYIQAYGWREDAGPEPAMGLAPERPSLLTVHIGPDEKPRPDPPFPEGQIDFSSGPVGVTVQLEVAGAAVTALGKNERVQHEMQFFNSFRGDFPTQLFHMLDKLMAAPEPSAGSQIAVGLASDEITLPVAGDSTRALFAVWPQAGVQEVQGRIAIIYRNRIVQTACLQMPVTLPRRGRNRGNGGGRGHGASAAGRPGGTAPVRPGPDGRRRFREPPAADRLL